MEEHPYTLQWATLPPPIKIVYHDLLPSTMLSVSRVVVAKLVCVYLKHDHNIFGYLTGGCIWLAIHVVNYK